MRLTDAEVKIIVGVIESKLSNQKADLYLFGSRTDETKRGGDIDLLLTTHDSNTRSYLSENKFRILTEIKDLIGDQKIDLIICTIDQLEDDVFLKHAFKNAVLLGSLPSDAKP